MKKKSNAYFKSIKLYAVALVLLLLVCLAYSNHFKNGFYFDDIHTIVENDYIRDITKIPIFFTDIASFGTMPDNRGYRPVVTSLNAVDYWLGGGLEPFYFHLSIFLSYLVLLSLLYILFKRIFNSVSQSQLNRWIAILAVGFYGVHTANSETINYIISRSDSFSTLCIIAALVLYTTKIGRKYYLYLLALMLAIFTKEIGVVFAPLLFFYVLFFEENISLSELLTLKKRREIYRAVKKTFPAFIIAIGLFYLTRNNFFIEDESTKLIVSSHTNTPFQLRWKYFYSQWVAIAHYIGNFILPLDLSADPDLGIIDSMLNRKVLLSLFLIVCLWVIAFITSGNRTTRPIAFGIVWFFLALVPTSTFHVLSQFSNDHRTFLPYIGLVISLAWAIKWLYLEKISMAKNHKQIMAIGALIYFVIVSLHAYGTYQRNMVWSSSEKLWKDASTKSPENGRALMNYGLILMARGQYDETLPYFEKALTLLPYWAYSNINMGILQDAMEEPELAETYFKNAIRYQPLVPDAYICYGRFLKDRGRIQEAIDQLEEGLRISPAHIELKKSLEAYKKESGITYEDRIQMIENSLPLNPSVDDYINQSLAYYKLKAYEKCITACEHALKINPRSEIAWNNICSAYNALQLWAKAAHACKAALDINPDFERAKNNLLWAKQNLPEGKGN